MISLLFVSLILGLGGIHCNSVENGVQSSLIRNFDTFSSNFNKAYLNKDSESNGEIAENYVTSPLGVFLPLFVLCRGAAGTTEAQLQNVFHANCQDSKMKDGYISFFSHFEHVKNATVKIATGLFVSKNNQVESEFKDKEQGILSFADLRESFDFAQGEESARVINDWVKERTFNLISDVVRKDDFNEFTSMVIANTLYFKANWKYKFDGIDTKDGIFTNIEGRQQTVPFMIKDGLYRTRHVPGLESQIFELPFEGGEFSFLIFLPDAGKSLRTLETRLGEFDLNSVLNIENGLSKSVRYDDQDVLGFQLHVPKFNVTSSIELKPILRSMGLEDLIDREGNLSKMVAGNLKLSGAKQDVKFELNENGVTAAAATVLNVAQLSSKFQSVNIWKIDRPFTFVIRHHCTGNNLFLGSVRSF